MTFSPRRRILDQTNDAALLAAIVRVYGSAASVMAKSLATKRRGVGRAQRNRTPWKRHGAREIKQMRRMPCFLAE
jgi:hypothetical protein